MSKYFVDYNNHTFLFKNYGYGYIKDRKLYVFSFDEYFEFELSNLRFSIGTTDNKHNWVFTPKTWNSHYYIPDDEFFCIIRIHNAYSSLPDILLPSGYCYNLFHKLIRNYEKSINN